MSGKLHEKKKREKQKRMLTENMFWVEAKAEAAPKEKKLEKNRNERKTAKSILYCYGVCFVNANWWNMYLMYVCIYVFLLLVHVWSISEPKIKKITKIANRKKSKKKQ